ncbi:MAG: hypothetical protein KAT47_01350 [Candidatus Aegiribacteria sp.]|nr:hypothetical protein [Candidatus Aegiribacteria sp.]
MRYAMILIFAAMITCAAIDIELVAKGGPSFPTGQWGNSLSTGVDVGLSVSWVITPSLKVGGGINGSVFGSTDQGSVTLTLIKPGINVGYYLRPWGNVFNPGIECGFGVCRSSLSNDDGADPVSWDPFWRVGMRWDFSMGAGFRGRVGADYSSVLGEIETGDSFILLFGISREVTL